MAVTVIGGALLAVFQDLIGLVDFLELHFAAGVARVLVRVPFHRQLAERRLELAVVRVPFAGGDSYSYVFFKKLFRS